MAEIDPIRRAEHAARLLADDILAAAFDGLDACYVAAWRSAKTIEAREEAHRMMLSVGKLKADLQSMVTTGTLTARREKELRGSKPFWK